MSVMLCDGDSPFTGFSPLFTTTFYPLFPTTIDAGHIVRVKKSPLMIAGRPLFSLYIKSSEKCIVKEHRRWTVL